MRTGDFGKRRDNFFVGDRETDTDFSLPGAASDDCRRRRGNRERLSEAEIKGREKRRRFYGYFLPMAFKIPSYRSRAVAFSLLLFWSFFFLSSVQVFFLTPVKFSDVKAETLKASLNKRIMCASARRSLFNAAHAYVCISNTEAYIDVPWVSGRLSNSWASLRFDVSLKYNLRWKIHIFCYKIVKFNCKMFDCREEIKFILKFFFLK